MNIKKVHNYAYRVNGKLVSVVKVLVGCELFSPNVNDNVLKEAAQKIFGSSRNIAIAKSDYEGFNKIVVTL